MFEDSVNIFAGDIPQAALRILVPRPRRLREANRDMGTRMVSPICGAASVGIMTRKFGFINFVDVNWPT